MAIGSGRFGGWGFGGAHGQPNPQNNSNNQGGSGQDTSQSNSDQTTTKEDPANKQTDVDPLAGFWEDKDTGTGEDKTPDKSTQQSGQTDQSTTSSDFMKQYLEGLDFLPKDLDLRETFEKMQNGDFDDFKDLMQNQGKQVYVQSLRDMSRYVENKVQSAVDDAVKKATSTTRAEGAINKMHEQLQFTSDPTIKPIAESIFTRAMAKTNHDVNKSITLTQTYFGKLAQQTMHAMKDTAPPSRPSGDVPHRGGSRQEQMDMIIEEMFGKDETTQRPGEPDWFELLSTQ